MTATTAYPADTRPGFLRRIEMWLDERGKPAWVGASVVGLIFAWPVGLGILGYAIWSDRLFTKKHNRSCTGFDGHHAMRHRAMASVRPSGNAAFDAYKVATLERLENEQQAFEDFLGRLREAKDKAEFDEFMDSRAKEARSVDEREDA